MTSWFLLESSFGCYTTEFMPFKIIWRMHRKPSHCCLKKEKGSPRLKLRHQASAPGLRPGLSRSPVIPYQVRPAVPCADSSAGIGKGGKRPMPTATFYKWATTETLSMGGRVSTKPRCLAEALLREQYQIVFRRNEWQLLLFRPNK